LGTQRLWITSSDFSLTDHRPADRDVDLVGGLEGLARVAVVVAHRPPPLVAVTSMRHRVLQRQRASARSVNTLAATISTTSSSTEAATAPDVAARARLGPTRDRGRRCRAVRRARRAPQHEQQRGQHGAEHHRARDREDAPQVDDVAACGPMASSTCARASARRQGSAAAAAASSSGRSRRARVIAALPVGGSGSAASLGGRPLRRARVLGLGPGPDSVSLREGATSLRSWPLIERT
jgi:hypothetical protein